MENKNNNSTSGISTKSPGKALKTMMDINIHEAKTILKLSEDQGCLDSQEFLDWQDELNAISVAISSYITE